MTTTPYDDSALQAALRCYAEHPLRDGDVVLLVDDTLCLELEQLTTQWDDVLRRNTGRVLRESASRVVLAVSRAGEQLRPSDFQLWRDLHAELRDSDVDLLPVRVLPAA